MQNQHVEMRLRAAQQHLMAAYTSGQMMSSASRGREREAFISLFLSEMLPTAHRFGSGDITDAQGLKSGQVDIVIEYPFLPSLHSPGLVRLYLADSVAAVIEVKSDLAKQWDEVETTARNVKQLSRYSKTGMYGGRVPAKIPVFAVGYTGWSTICTLQGRVQTGEIDGILVIEHGLFAAFPGPLLEQADWYQNYGVMEATGPAALWGLLCCLTEVTSAVTGISRNLFKYSVSPPYPDGGVSFS